MHLDRVSSFTSIVLPVDKRHFERHCIDKRHCIEFSFGRQSTPVALILMSTNCRQKEICPSSKKPQKLQENQTQAVQTMQLYNPRRTSTWRWRTWRGQPRSWSGRWAFGTVVLGKWNGAKVKPAECWWTSDALMIANFSLTSPRWLWGWWWSLRRQQGRRSL